MPAPEVSLLEQLSANSAPYRDPLLVLDWRALSGGQFWLPPQAISLYGLPEFDALSEAARIRLSQYELIGIAQAGVALERSFLELAARRLRKLPPLAEYAYLLHEMREEAGHSLMFLKVVAASGLTVPESPVTLPRLTRPWLRLPARDLLYWFSMVVSEDVPDKLNRFVRRQSGSEVCPLIRQMMTLQSMDRSRHLTYARHQLQAALAAQSRFGMRWLGRVLDRYFNRFVRAYLWPRAELYRLAGLGDGEAWRRLALRNPHRREFALRLLAPTMRLLAADGVQVRLR